MQILSPENIPYLTAFGVLLILGAVELTLMFAGVGLSDWLENLLPDADADGGGASGAGLLGWIRGGDVPLLITLVVFLSVFGILGLAVQALGHAIFSHPLPGWPAAVGVFFVAIPCTRWFGSRLARLLPRDETEAVSEDTLIGRMGVVSQGTAAHGKPSEVRVQDQFGHSHYVMAEPKDPEQSLPQGTEVILMSRSGHVYKAEKNPYPWLTKDPSDPSDTHGT